MLTEMLTEILSAKKVLTEILSAKKMLTAILSAKKMLTAKTKLLTMNKPCRLGYIDTMSKILAACPIGVWLACTFHDHEINRWRVLGPDLPVSSAGMWIPFHPVCGSRPHLPARYVV